MIIRYAVYICGFLASILVDQPKLMYMREVECGTYLAGMRIAPSIRKTSPFIIGF
jgi:hypothetical protein